MTDEPKLKATIHLAERVDRGHHPHQGDADMSVRSSMLGAAAAMMALSMAAQPEPDFRYRRDKPRPKSNHKRKFKGSKAAKRASRRKSS